MQCRLGMKWR